MEKVVRATPTEQPSSRPLVTSSGVETSQSRDAGHEHRNSHDGVSLIDHGPQYHVFERAGLGKAPFRFVFAYEKRGPLDLGNGHMVGAPGQPMGTCQFCGQDIAICCVIKSADDKTFEVGSDCVAKTGDAGLRKAVRKVAADAQKARETARWQAAKERLNSDNGLRARLINRKSPNKARPNDTGLDWALWMMQNAGHAGRMDVTRYIDRVEKLAVAS